MRGPIAYYRTRADAGYWSRHWAGQSLEHLLAVAATSQLTRFLERHIKRGHRVIEAGCGLGQYVIYFAERGARVTGVDFSEEAVATHRSAFPASDVVVADLTRLPFPDSSFDVYVSLGVIEHYESGADEILAEAHRVLTTDGLLLLATPYANASRRLLRRLVARRQRVLADAGGEFYQYAFDERALDSILGEAGFDVFERAYYDPGRGLRDLYALLRPRRGGQSRRPSAASRDRVAHAHAHGPLKRSVLYARPTLKALAHMQIVAARVAKG
ncbi:MAG: methyltransferase domain-containing protein [Actinobacteria bacterium]|nr:methyltransferase domain-containing protein [Actinomycetota bacterium]